MRRIYVFLFIICFFIGCLNAQETPKEQNGFLYFPLGNKNIPLNNTTSQVENIFMIFKNHKRVVIIYQEKVPNYRKVQLQFYDFCGKEVAQSEILKGEFDFFFMEQQERILIGQKAKLIEACESYLYDLNGNLINVLVHDQLTKKIGITPDEKYAWFVSNQVRERRPGEPPLYEFFPNNVYTADNRIMIFDTTTGILQKELAIHGTQVEIMLSDQSYFLEFSPPDLPG